MPRRPAPPRWFALAAAGLALSLVGACANHPDYRDTHRITVERRDLSMVIALPEAADAPADAADAGRLANFVESYLDRGEGAMELSLPDGAAGRAAALVLAERLFALGLRPSELAVRFVPAPTPAPATTAAPRSALLSFAGYIAHVPQCGDVSENAAFMPNNTPPVNFGCATQRNIGLMVRNPRDLLRARGAEGRDGMRAVDVLDKWHIGKETASEGAVKANVNTTVGGSSK